MMWKTGAMPQNKELIACIPGDGDSIEMFVVTCQGATLLSVGGEDVVGPVEDVARWFPIDELLPLLEDAWSSEDPQVDDDIFGEVTVRYRNGEEHPEHYLMVDYYGDLCYLDSGDDIGWNSDCLDRWCPVDAVLRVLS